MAESEVNFVHANLQRTGVQYMRPNLHKRDYKHHLNQGHDPLHRLHHHHILPEHEGKHDTDDGCGADHRENTGNNSNGY